MSRSWLPQKNGFLQIPTAFGRIALAVLIIVLCIGTAKTVVNFLQLSPYRYGLDYGEGPLLSQANSLLNGENVYLSDLTDYPYTIANYPPLYISLFAFTSRLVGLSLWTGRAITGLATLLSALFLFLILYRLTKDLIAGMICALLFLTFPYVTHWSTLARVDMLALSLCLLGMSIAVTWPTRAWSPVLCATVLVAAVYTRQSYLLAGPLAVTGWYWMQNKRALRWFVLTFITEIVIVYALLQLLTDGGFFVHTIAANTNSYSLLIASILFLNLALMAPVLIALALQQALSSESDQRIARRFLVLFLLGSTLSAVTVGKVGANINYFLELVAALTLLTGYAVARWRRSSSSHGWLRVVLVATLALQAFWLVHQADRFRGSMMAQQLDQTEELHQLEHLVQIEPGKILADDHLEILVLNHIEVHLQPFEMMQLANQHRWSEERVVSDIQAQRFGMILVSEEPAMLGNNQIRGSWSPGMWQAIQDRYYAEQTLADMVVYRPKPLHAD